MQIPPPPSSLYDSGVYRGSAGQLHCRAAAAMPPWSEARCFLSPRVFETWWSRDRQRTWTGFFFSSPVPFVQQQAVNSACTAVQSDIGTRVSSPLTRSGLTLMNWGVNNLHGTVDTDSLSAVGSFLFSFPLSVWRRCLSRDTLSLFPNAHFFSLWGCCFLCLQGCRSAAKGILNPTTKWWTTSPSGRERRSFSGESGAAFSFGNWLYCIGFIIILFSRCLGILFP